jgi:T1SS-143 domain-containing protein
MAEAQNSKQNVQAPQAGQTVIVSAIPGQDIVLEAAFDQAEAKLDSGNVIFEFANGGQVVLDFSDLGIAQAPNVVMPDGTVLNMEEFLASLGEGDVEPAAGPEAGADGSGGVGEYQDDAGNLIEGVNRLGVLDPRDFTALSVEGLEASNSLPSAGIVDGAADEDGMRISEMTPFDGNDDERDGDHPARFAYVEGLLSYDFGGDGPDGTNPFVWSLDGLAAKGVTSEGNTLLYEVVDGVTLNAYYMGMPDFPDNDDNGNGPSVKAPDFQEVPLVKILVFTIEVTDLETGAYRFELYRPLDHSDPATEDDIVYNFSYTITDGTGDTAVGGVNMIVDDDSPIWKEGEANVSGLVVEEALSYKDGDFSQGSGQTSDNTDETSGGGLSGSLAALVAFGADGPGEFSLLTDTSALPSLFSKGDAVQYIVEGNTLIAYVDEYPSEPVDEGALEFSKVYDGGYRVVFTLEVNPDGSWYFDLQDQLDHVDDGSNSKNFDLITGDGEEDVTSVSAIDFSSLIKVTDGDGDVLTGAPAGSFTIAIQDDVPVVTVEVNGQALGGLNVSLDETVGEDRFNSDIGEIADGNDDDKVGALAQVRTSINGGLAGLFIVKDAVGADEPGTDVTGAFSFDGFSDGSGLETNLSVTGGGKITLFLLDGVIVGSETGDDGEQVGDPVFTIEIVEAPAGSYQLETTLFRAIDHGKDGNLYDSELELYLADNGAVQLKYEVTRSDYDGDTVTTSAMIDLISRATEGEGEELEVINKSYFSFADDGPTFTGLGNLVVNGSFEEPNVNGWAFFTDGNDVPGWTNAVGNIEIQDSGAGGVAAQDGNQLLELDAHGGSNTNATVTQSIPTAHYNNLVLSFWFASRDNGGDIATTNTAEVWWNGSLLGTITDDVPGRWTQYTFNVEGNGDGSDVLLAFKGVGTDDSYGGFIDNVSVYSMPTVDEEGLRPEGNGALLFASATLSVDFGADGPGAWTGLTLDTILSSEGFAVALEGAARADGWYGVDTEGEDVFKVEVDLAAGTYSFTLLKQLDHDLGSDLMKLDFGFTVSDGDDDFVNGMFSVGVFDDAPIAVPDVDAGEYAGNILENDILGADLPAKVIYVNDVGPQEDGKIVVNGQFGTLTVDSDTGVYSYDTYNLADITLTNAGDDSAGFKNTFGYFIVDDENIPTGDGHIIWTNTNTAPGLAGSTDPYTIEDVDPDSVVWFLIPNGGAINNGNPNFVNGAPIDVVEIDGSWVVRLDGDSDPLLGRSGSNNVPLALFSDPDFNDVDDDYEYLTDNEFPGELNWEDILGGGDRDNNDANIEMVVEYEPVGSDVFDYTVRDYDGDTASSTLTITPGPEEEPLNPTNIGEFV